jgi:hypothetical protein
VPLVYRGEARGVVCYGLGLEQHLGDRVVLYGGAAHNESAYVAERDSFAAWDLTDLTAGLTFDTGRARLALGLGYAWGSKGCRSPYSAGRFGFPRCVTRFSRWTFSLGAFFNSR